MPGKRHHTNRQQHPGQQTESGIERCKALDQLRKDGKRIGRRKVPDPREEGHEQDDDEMLVLKQRYIDQSRPGTALALDEADTRRRAQQNEQQDIVGCPALARTVVKTVMMQNSVTAIRI